MEIYSEFITRVEEGESFHIDFEKRNMKVGKDYLIKEGEYDKTRGLIVGLGKFFNNLSDVLENIESLYKSYKYSLPSERSDSKRRHYFKALPIEEITDEQLFFAQRREVACAALEGVILCQIIAGELVWDEEIMEGKWFWQSKIDPDLVLLRSWVEGK